MDDIAAGAFQVVERYAPIALVYAKPGRKAESDAWLHAATDDAGKPAFRVSDEDAYRPSLESAGFSVTLREARWHEHRLFKPTDGLAHVHVFGPDCPETIRHVMLRDWLRTHPDDAAEYAAIKRRAAEATNAHRGTGMDYNLVKEPYLRSLLDRIFTANGLL